MCACVFAFSADVQLSSCKSGCIFNLVKEIFPDYENGFFMFVLVEESMVCGAETLTGSRYSYTLTFFHTDAAF